MQTSVPSVWRVVLVLGLVILAAAAGLVTVLKTEGRNGPLHHTIARSFLGYPPQRAVDAFNAKDWDLALREARHCVSVFEDAGFREQARLESGHVLLPSPVRTTNEEMVEIMRRGSLNSLAHCSLIQAEPAEQLSRSDEALRSYATTAKLTYGRVYDSDAHWFWSPAARAAEATGKAALSQR